MRQRKLDRDRILEWKKKKEKKVPALVYLTHEEGQNDSNRPIHLAKPWDRYLSRPVIKFTKGEAKVQPHRSVFNNAVRNTDDSLLLSTNTDGNLSTRLHDGMFTAVKMKNGSFCFAGKHDGRSSSFTVTRSTAGLYTPERAAGIIGTDRHVNEFYASY